jgi:hypothetical protein
MRAFTDDRDGRLFASFGEKRFSKNESVFAARASRTTTTTTLHRDKTRVW